MSTEPATAPDVATDHRWTLESLLGIPFTDGNRVDILRNGDQAFPALLEAIRGATRTIDMLWFLWGRGAITDQVAGALAARARSGVRVRVLLDAFGAHGIDRGQVALLRDAGCQLRFYRPLRTWRLTDINFRTHRRVLLCDEEVALTGGTGVDQAWTGDAGDPASWRDMALRVRGPAVAGLRGAFTTAWSQTKGPLIEPGDRFPAAAQAGTVAVQVIQAASRPGWNASLVAVLALLHLATRRVRISTPYARVPDVVLQALGAAVDRGVQVQLLVPGPHVDRPVVALQSAHRYGALMDVGVQVWRYQPTMLHAKMITVDHRLAMVGTTNLDVRSLALNEQVNLVLDDAAVTAALDADFEDDLAVSEQLTAQGWQARGRGRRALECAADVLARPWRGLGNLGESGLRP